MVAGGQGRWVLGEWANFLPEVRRRTRPEARNSQHSNVEIFPWGIETLRAQKYFTPWKAWQLKGQRRRPHQAPLRRFRLAKSE